MPVNPKMVYKGVAFPPREWERIEKVFAVWKASFNPLESKPTFNAFLRMSVMAMVEAIEMEGVD